jgi:hypothetical protein
VGGCYVPTLQPYSTYMMPPQSTSVKYTLSVDSSMYLYHLSTNRGHTDIQYCTYLISQTVPPPPTYLLSLSTYLRTYRPYRPYLPTASILYELLTTCSALCTLHCLALVLYVGSWYLLYDGSCMTYDTLHYSVLLSSCPPSFLPSLAGWFSVG